MGALLALWAPSSLQAITWNQPAGGDFNTPGNWDTNAVPLAGDTALFNIAMSGPVTLSANATPGSISFDTNATSFTLGALGGSTITTANGGAISILSTLTAVNQIFTINAPLILTPNSTTTPGAFTIQNDGTSSSTILVIAGGISSSTTTGTETLTLAGANTGTNLISGNIVNGSASSLALVKSGAGVWTLSGANTYSGGTSIAAGTLALSGGTNRLLSTGVLSFTGSTGTFDVGSTSQTLGGLSFPTITGSNSYVITGAGGTLTVNNGNMTIGGGNTTTSGSQTVSMAGLSTFIYNKSSGSFNVGGTSDNASAAITGSGTLTLATTNTITAGSFNIGQFSTGLGSLNSGTVHLGQTNTINTAILLVGGQKTTGVLDFQSLVTPTLKIRGTTGLDTDRTAITVASNNSGITAAVGTFDLTTGGTLTSTLDAMVSTLMIGQNLRNLTSLGLASTGTFTMALGTMDATTIVIGQQGVLTAGNTFSGAATGTLNLNGGTITAVTVTLADKQSGAATQTITSNFNLNSGTLNVTTLQRGALGTGAGAATATINFNWVDGTISNITGSNQTVNGNSAVNGLTGGLNIVLNNTGNVSGTHTWNVSGTQVSTVQNTVTLSGAGGLSKTGTGTLILAGANTYAGPTVVTSGTLQFGLKTSLYNATTSSWTTANLKVSSGATAAFNVGGPGEFTAADISSLLALSTGSGGFLSGSFIGLDTSNAGGSFTYNAAIRNPNLGSNVLGLTKLGSGTLVLTGANTYTGGTNIAAGTLALSGGNNRLLSTGILNFTGASGTLDVGSTSQTVGGLTFLITGTNSNTITGATGTLTVTGGNIQIGGGGATFGGTNVVDMSGLGTFNYANSAGSFSVGGRADVGVGTSAGGTLSMAMSNTITAASFTVSPVSSGNSSPNTGIVHLGQTNVINASTINIGVGKSSSTLDFQNLVNPTLKIRGTGGTDADRATIIVGTNDSGVAASTATLDLTNGGTVVSTLDAMVSTLTIGRNTRNLTAGFSSTGTFTMGLGTLNATTIIIGQQGAVTAGNSSGAATGTLNLNGGTIIATTFTLADKLSGAATQTITSNFNLYSGTLNATTIQRGTAGTGAGADTATINFNWVDGTIGNIAGANQTVNGNSAVSGLTGGLNIVLNNTGNVSGTHIWNVSGTQTATIQSTAILSGAGSLTKTGTGTLVFAGANTYTGLTIVTAGELDLNTTGGQSIAGNLIVSGGIVRLLQASQINSASNLVVSGGVFDVQTFNQTVANVQLTGGSITGTTGVLTSVSAFDLQAGTASAILGGTAGVIKTTSGTVVLSAANTFSGGTTVSGGLLVGTSTTALGTNSGLAIASGATFAYRPTAAGALTLGTGALNLVGGSTIGAALAGTVSQSVISSSSAAVASGAVSVNIYFIPGVTAAAGTSNLITAASGLTSGGASYTLGAIYNNTAYSITAFQATDTAISVNVSSVTALTNAYWKGGLSTGNNVWAVSSSSASNWSTTSDGTGATALVPGSGTAVIFSATGAANQGSMVLGASMTIKSLTVNDTNAVTLNADGNTLTITNVAGISVSSGAGTVTLNAPIILGAAQSWTNNSSNALAIGGSVTLGSNTLTVTGTGSTTISGALSGTGGLTKSGAGSLTLSGNNTNSGALAIGAGTVNISGVYAGVINVGTTSGSKAVLNILSGASIILTGANNVTPGSGAGGIGVINQTGGDVVSPGQIIFAAGAGAYGFYNMSGGTLTAGDRFRVGGQITNSIGILYQSGGTILLTAATNGNGLEIGANGSGPFTNVTGVGYFTGGALTTVTNHIGYDAINTTGALRGEQTVAGSAVITINGTTTLGVSTADVGILNLNGGVYATKQIVKGANGTGIVNFNGGTLKAAASATTAFFNGLTSANVFAGGLTVDTNGQSITIGQALLAPAGNGVTTIAVTNGGSGYVGAPYVAISGTGSGATAVANMVDDGTGNGTFKIGSITITSPGTGYTGTPTVTLTGGGGTGAAVDTAVLATNTSGGITKTGTGTLTLSGTNTYTGATVVNAGGTLAAGSTSAFGINSAATVDGTLRLAGKNNSIGSLAGASTGIVENANATSATLTVGGDNSSQTYNGTVQNGSGSGVLNFVKVGSGTQTMTGDSSYTGTTTVSQGTLQIGVSGQGSTSSSSSVSVNGANATLAGSGMVGGAVTVTSGFIQPGDTGGTSVGTLSVGSLNLTSGGTAVFQIEGASLNDRIMVLNSGGLTLNGKVSVTTSLTGLAFSTAFAAGNKYDLLDWTGLLNGTFDAGTLVRNGSQDNGLQFDLPDLSSLSLYWDVSNFLTDGSITVVVPEPSRALLLLMACAALLGRRRRRSWV